jgi:hypothetical protein
VNIQLFSTGQDVRRMQDSVFLFLNGEEICELLPQFIIGYDPEALQSSLNPRSSFKKKIDLILFSNIFSLPRGSYCTFCTHIVRIHFSFNYSEKFY